MFTRAKLLHFSTLIRTEFLVKVTDCICGTYSGVCEWITEYFKIFIDLVISGHVERLCLCRSTSDEDGNPGLERVECS